MRLEVSHGFLVVKQKLMEQEGDLILTGTPAGVGPIKAGEKFQAKLTYPGLKGEVLDEYSFDVVDRKGPYEFSG